MSARLAKRSLYRRGVFTAHRGKLRFRARKTEKYFPRNYTALGKLVTVPAQRDKIPLAKPQVESFSERENVMYRQTSRPQYPVGKADPTAMEVTFKNKLCRALPDLCIAESVGFGIALLMCVELRQICAASALVDFPASRTISFYLIFHTTIISQRGCNCKCQKVSIFRFRKNIQTFQAPCAASEGLFPANTAALRLLA